LIAVAAASPAAGQRYSGGNVRFSELYYFWRQLAWIALGIPVMIGISMTPKERARRLCLFGAASFFVLLVFVPIIGPEVNGAHRRRAVRHGAGRRHTEIRPARAAHRLYLLGDRRGVRADRLLRDRAPLPVHRRARADQASRRGQ